MSTKLSSSLLLFSLLSCSSPERVPESGRHEQADISDTPADRVPPDAASSNHDGWRSLLDGRSLDGWAITSFGGEGEVRVENGAVRLDFGSPITGIHYEGEVPTHSYELALTATRVSGSDFFCGLTFPVGESHCTLVLGGWGGAWCGLSCIDGKDAADNDTGHARDFETGRAYAVRLRVTPERITAWVDDETIVDQDLVNHEVSLRPEVAPSRPLGVAAFATIAEIRDLRIRELD